MGKEIDASTEAFSKVIKDQDVLAYIELDDAYVNGFIKQLTQSKDPVLKLLSNSFYDRHLFSYVELSNEPDLDYIEKIRQKALNNKYGKYFYYEIAVSKVAYLQTNKDDDVIDINAIKVLLPNGDIKDLDDYSPIIRSLVSSSYKKVERIYYFEELNE